jgi:hypothetical protein
MAPHVGDVEEAYSLTWHKPISGFAAVAVALFMLLLPHHAVAII